jgi:hypothetical protein
MTDEPSSDGDKQANTAAPEVLKPQADDAAEPTDAAGSDAPTSAADKPVLKSRRTTYRPSHKATFFGLAMVVLILAVNAGVILFVLKKQSVSKAPTEQGQVTINQGVLDKLGVNRSAVGDAGVELTVNPDAKFNGKLQVGGDVSIGGQLKLNGTFTAAGASFAKLQGGDTALAQLNVNGNTTLSNVNVRNELDVTGVTRLLGPVTMSQLLTVNNLNVAANLSVGGVLSANGFHTSTLTVDSVLNIGGHIVTTGGNLPTVAAGNALGSNGTIAMSGSDAAGTVSIAVGVGATAGTIGTVTFHTKYSATPRVVVSPVGNSFGGIYINRTANGFTIVTNAAVPPGGYAFDYIVIQ